MRQIMCDVTLVSLYAVDPTKWVFWPVLPIGKVGQLCKLARAMPESDGVAILSCSLTEFAGMKL